MSYRKQPAYSCLSRWRKKIVTEPTLTVSLAVPALAVPALAVPEVVTDTLLEEVVERLVGAFTPVRVILFGSYAEGRATADSDLDLLVVTEQALSRQERLKRTRGLFRDMPLPIQVITISRQEFVETRAVIGGIAYPAAKYGRVIYEKS